VPLEFTLQRAVGVHASACRFPLPLGSHARIL